MVFAGDQHGLKPAATAPALDLPGGIQSTRLCPASSDLSELQICWWRGLTRLIVAPTHRRAVDAEGAAVLVSGTDRLVHIFWNIARRGVGATAKTMGMSLGVECTAVGCTDRDFSESMRLQAIRRPVGVSPALDLASIGNPAGVLVTGCDVLEVNIWHLGLAVDFIADAEHATVGAKCADVLPARGGFHDACSPSVEIGCGLSPAARLTSTVDGAGAAKVGLHPDPWLHSFGLEGGVRGRCIAWWLGRSIVARGRWGVSWAGDGRHDRGRVRHGVHEGISIAWGCDRNGHAHGQQGQPDQGWSNTTPCAAITHAKGAPRRADGEGASASQEDCDDQKIEHEWFVSLPHRLRTACRRGNSALMKWWLTLKQKLKDLFEEYGKVALWVYGILWAAVLIGYAAAIQLGFEIDGAAQTSGVLIAAWVTVKATQPVRIAITLVLTPFVARFFQREPAPAAAE